MYKCVMDMLFSGLNLTRTLLDAKKLRKVFYSGVGSWVRGWIRSWIRLKQHLFGKNLTNNFTVGLREGSTVGKKEGR